MRKPVVLLLLHLALLGSVLAAQFEITADDMRDSEDVFKSLDSNLTLKDPKAAAEARELQAYFQKVEGYYVSQPDQADGVGFARKTHSLAGQVAQAVAAGNFDAALEAQAQLSRSCKTCHDIYKNR